MRVTFFVCPKKVTKEKAARLCGLTATWKLIDLGRHANTRIHARVHSTDIPVRRPTEIDQFPAHKRAIETSKPLRSHSLSKSNEWYLCPPSSPRKNGVQIGVKWQGCHFRLTRGGTACEPTAIWALFFRSRACQGRHFLVTFSCCREKDTRAPTPKILRSYDSLRA